MINDLLNLLPWDKAAAMFAAFIGATTFVSILATRWPRARAWMGVAVQDILGITQVRLTIEGYIKDRTAADEVIERAQQKTLDITQTTQVQMQDLTKLQAENARQMQSHLRNNQRHLPGRARKPREAMP